MLKKGEIARLKRKEAAAWLTPRPNGNNIRLHHAAASGKLDEVPRKILRDNMLTKDHNGWTILHFAAAYGHLYQIPKDYITKEHITERATAPSLTMPIHIAAINGQLKYIPEELVTTEILLLEDGYGKSALLEAAAYGHLDQLPIQSLNSEALVKANKGLKSPLDLAVECGHLHQLIGIKLPVEAKEIVGEDWWNKNQAALIQRENLAVTNENQEVDIDIY